MEVTIERAEYQIGVCQHIIDLVIETSHFGAVMPRKVQDIMRDGMVAYIADHLEMPEDMAESVMEKTAMQVGMAAMANAPLQHSNGYFYGPEGIHDKDGKEVPMEQVLNTGHEVDDLLRTFSQGMTWEGAAGRPFHEQPVRKAIDPKDYDAAKNNGYTGELRRNGDNGLPRSAEDDSVVTSREQMLKAASELREILDDPRAADFRKHIGIKGRGLESLLDTVLGPKGAPNGIIGAGGLGGDDGPSFGIMSPGVSLDDARKELADLGFQIQELPGGAGFGATFDFAGYPDHEKAMEVVKKAMAGHSFENPRDLAKAFRAGLKEAGIEPPNLNKPADEAPAP